MKTLHLYQVFSAIIINFMYNHNIGPIISDELVVSNVSFIEFNVSEL